MPPLPRKPRTVKVTVSLDPDDITARVQVQGELDVTVAYSTDGPGKKLTSLVSGIDTGIDFDLVLFSNIYPKIHKQIVDVFESLQLEFNLDV